MRHGLIVLLFVLTFTSCAHEVQMVKITPNCPRANGVGSLLRSWLPVLSPLRAAFAQKTCFTQKSRMAPFLSPYSELDLVGGARNPALTDDLKIVRSENEPGVCSCYRLTTLPFYTYPGPALETRLTWPAG